MKNGSIKTRQITEACPVCGAKQSEPCVQVFSMQRANGAHCFWRDGHPRLRALDPQPLEFPSKL